MLLLARELRRLGWRGPVGFFLHIPFPPLELFRILPDPRGFLEALLEHDLVGFHVRESLDNYAYACRRELGASWESGRLRAGMRGQRVGLYPIGIDPEAFLPGRARAPQPAVSGVLKRVVRGRKLVLGVDRLDYTKGIPERLLGFERFVRAHPRWKKRVSLIQIASPSRTRVRSYAEHKQTIDALVGRLNAELGEHDWVPIRYLYRSYPREQLAEFYREADVGLVTPLRDGMNLVAKEFVAAQPSEDPGVLVLSRFAGAAEDLSEALIVNPYIASELAGALERALEMPLVERRARHRALLERVLGTTAASWARAFLEDLRTSAERPIRQARRRAPTEDVAGPRVRSRG